MLKYLIPYFDVLVTDKFKDLSDIESVYNVKVTDLGAVAACDIVILAVPVAEMEGTIKNILPHLHKGQLVIDLCSVKCVPMALLEKYLPVGVDAVSLHPLFGPQSGKNGIHGMNVTICPLRGERTDCVVTFLQKTLGLQTHITTPEQHDQEMAYVQGLTHMIAKVFVHMDVPAIHQQTKTYALLRDMVELIRYDSDELFLAIQRDNPYVKNTTEKFFEAVKAIEDRLSVAKK